MTAWETLLTIALLGTERRKLALPNDDPAPLGIFNTNDAEHQLLAAAATMAIYRRAGYMPATDSAPTGEPAPDETLPPCSPRAARRLIMLLQHPHRYHVLIGEWLVIIARMGRRVPHPVLPALFAEAQRDKMLLPLMLPVLGERGRWLARQNAAWEKLLQPPEDTILRFHTIFAPDEPDVNAARAAEARAITALKSQVSVRETGALEILTECRHTWSDALVDAFIAKLLKEEQTSPAILLYDDFAAVFALSIPRAQIERVLRRLAPDDTRKQRPFFQSLVELLSLRREMLEELRRE